MTAKEKLHSLVDELSESEAEAALDLLVSRRHSTDPLAALLDAAPLDDEPVTSEEEDGVREAYEDLARGDVYSVEQIRREFG